MVPGRGRTHARFSASLAPSFGVENVPKPLSPLAALAQDKISILAGLKADPAHGMGNMESEQLVRQSPLVHTSSYYNIRQDPILLIQAPTDYVKVTGAHDKTPYTPTSPEPQTSEHTAGVTNN